MEKFEKGDVVQVEYTSPQAIENWMNGRGTVGPGDVGVVKYSAIWTHEFVTVTFPMLGTMAVWSGYLKLRQKGEACSSGGM